jgi:hypothetical protein
MEDIESYWKIARRSYYEAKSCQTASMGEAISRITHVLLQYASTTSQLIEADKWRELGPRVEVRPELPKSGELTFDQIRWECRVEFPGCDLKLPLLESAEGPEEALEKVFNKVALLLKEQRAKRMKEIEELREKANEIEEEAQEIEDAYTTMGAYALRQLNLVTQAGNPF